MVCLVMHETMTLNLCNFMFLPHTQYYSTTVAHSITCRKFQFREDKYMYFMFEINFKWTSATFYFVKYLPRSYTNNETHLLFKEQFIFFLLSRTCLSKTWSKFVAWARAQHRTCLEAIGLISNLLEKLFDSVVAFKLMKNNTSELTNEHKPLGKTCKFV